jgi:proteasome assembly chaperone (PAC2) family protein
MDADRAATGAAIAAGTTLLTGGEARDVAGAALLGGAAGALCDDVGVC